MNQPPTVLRGIVHGSTIEFESHLGPPAPARRTRRKEMNS